MLHGARLKSGDGQFDPTGSVSVVTAAAKAPLTRRDVFSRLCVVRNVGQPRCKHGAGRHRACPLLDRPQRVYVKGLVLFPDNRLKDLIIQS